MPWLPLVLLTTVYLLVLGSAAPWDAAVGAAVSAATLVGFRRLLSGPGRPRARGAGPLARLLAFPAFAAAVAVEVVHGTTLVASVVLGLRPRPRSGFVSIAVDGASEQGLAVLGLVLTLAPGTVLVDIDTGRRTLLVQALDAGDPEAVRRSHRRFYERYQRHVFP